MTKRQRREASKRPPFTAGFTKVPRVFIDSSVMGAIGAQNFLVYVAIRRFERRDRSASPTVTKLVDDGWIVAYVNQTTIAVLLAPLHQPPQLVEEISKVGSFRSVAGRRGGEVAEANAA